MAIKSKSPTNPASRFQTTPSFDEITRSKPHKPLTKGKTRVSGRNNQGEQTIWFRGGGHKRRYRVIDFKRDKRGVPAKVASVEYDPNRSARIALLHYADGEKRYILWPRDLQVGDTVTAGEDAEVDVGNALPLRKIPLGTQIHNVELRIGKGGQMVRRRLRPWPGTPSCPPARCAGCTWSATPPSAKWATWITRTCPWARRVATAGGAAGPTTGAS